MNPPPEVLDHVRGYSVGELGGRLNRHWQVRVGGDLLVLRRWHAEWPEISYELRVLSALAAKGWPVPVAVCEPFACEDAWWSLSPFLQGEPPPPEEGRERGRLLAAFHADTQPLENLGRRPGWRPALEVLNDPATDTLLDATESQWPGEVRALRWHLHHARSRLAELPTQSGPMVLIHGDFTPWNLRFKHGRLSGLLDFEFARPEHRLAEFALAWRGRHDEVVWGYHERSPLAETEWALLTPYWWAHLIEGACQLLRRGVWDDGWTLRMLLRRSPLMGEDADPYYSGAL